MTAVFAYAGLVLLVALAVYAIVRLTRSWKVAGRRWGGGSGDGR